MLFTSKKFAVGAALGSAGTGGDTTIEDGNYTVHIFYNNGSLVLERSINIDVLIVGGGGGGGPSFSGAGGGAGGLIHLQNQAVSNGTYNITVGAGATGLSNGGHSSIIGPSMTQTALGGGYGGGWGQAYNWVYKGANGGSGGGGASYNSFSPHLHAGGTGTVGQGNSGGHGSYKSYRPNRHTTFRRYGGGGGGGAGAAGTNAGVYGNTTTGGNGGNGVQINISGVNTYYAGGGAGGGSHSQGTAGLGGGGSVAHLNPAVGNGTNGLGGGGGAGQRYYNSHWSYGGYYGGDGVVVVRYLT